MNPQFDALEKAFEQRRALLVDDSAGATPEQVLVLETVGSVENFIAAVRRISGMEWLIQQDEDGIQPDDDFYRDELHRDNLLSGQILLVMTNQEALSQLQSLWRRYQSDRGGRWEHGRTKWRDLFDQLKTIRPWDVQDRLRGTGLIEDIQQRMAETQVRTRIEVELWFRQGERARNEARSALGRLVGQANGSVVKEVVIAAISYHALLVDIATSDISAIIEAQDARLIRADQIAFLRPIGQAMVRAADDEAVVEQELLERRFAKLAGLPVVALLDGLPLENHQYLAGRLLVDDPDGWASGYAAVGRVHGTAMASLIANGDLDAQEQPLARPIYVRPIMKAETRAGLGTVESIPDDELPVDLVHRAVRRLFEPEGVEPPAAPTVRIINLSIGDLARPFDRYPSPWARLIDWLAWEYRHKALFIISAGNCEDDVTIDGSLSSLSPNDLERNVLKAILTNASHRAVIAPAEAVNALTVGALHSDASTFSAANPLLFDLFPSSYMPSPINRCGPGFNRSIKPDILMPGGRQLYRQGNLGGGSTTLTVNGATSAPGQRVATPTSQRGSLTGTRYMRGTSNAAALTTRAAAQLLETLQQLRLEPNGGLLEDRYTPVLLKAVLAHGAQWGDAEDKIASVPHTTSHAPKEHIARFLGYGPVDLSRIFSCTDQCATLIGCAELGDGEAHVYSIPLPPSLSGQRVRRRLTITLAWITPTNSGDHRYRRAALWINPANNTFADKRCNADGRAVTRGTVQHEVLERESVLVVGA